jgi:8-oxo-dGTP pyrophosphatase MutT (NUDIX family)
MNRRIAARAIILQEDQLLCVRLRPTELAPHNGSFWCVPGGGLEPGEALLAGLERELIEETGIKPHVGNLLYVHQYKDDKSEYLEFLVVVTNAEDYSRIDLSATTHGMQELQEIRFVDPKSVILLPTFLTERPLAEDARLGATRCYSYL